MIPKQLFHFLLGTLRGRLVLTVAVVHATMMALFIGDLVVRQRALLLERQIQGATALSQSLATSAADWIAADDISGLQELVEGQRRYPEIRFAVLADREGRVLADTDKSKRGLYLLDLPREARQTVLSGSFPLVDVAVPAQIGGRHVGWARVGIGQKLAGEQLMEITRSGLLYALGAIAIGSAIAWLMGRRITRRLYAVLETIDQVRAGNRLARSPLVGDDEAAALAREFNAMLDVLAERDAELRASEQSYRSLIRKVQAAIVLHDGQGHILTSNPLAQELLGLSAEQLLGKSLIDPDWHFLREDGTVLPAGDYPASRVLSTRQPLRGMVTGIRRPDREEVAWMLVNAEPECDEAGNIALVVVSFVDITERKRSEEKEHLLSAIVQSSDDAIISKNLDGVILSWNAGAERIYGYSAEEAVGQPVSMLAPPKHASEQAEIMTRLRRGERVEHFTTERVRKDGRPIFVSLTVSPVVGEAGNIVAASTIARDITDRMLAETALSKGERELRDAQRIAHIGSWDWDAKTDTLAWSEEYYRIYGIDPKVPTPSYREHLEIYTPESAERLAAEAAKTMQSGAPYELELELAHPDANRRWIFARGEAKYHADGTVIGLHGISQDITAQKRAEAEIFRLNADLEQRVVERTNDLEAKRTELMESQRALMNMVEDLNEKTVALQNANAKLQELERLKSMFIASMSHELRTPLNSIIGFSSILMNEWLGPVNPEQQMNLATILRSGKHLLNLINDVIDVSKIEAGRIEVRIEQFDLYELISEAVQYVEQDVREKGLELRLELEHRTVRTDRSRLLQCIINLMSNALKFTETGGITVESSAEGAAGGQVRIAVRDTGIGIAPEDILRLFQPFVRLETPMKATVPGTGLGLYLTRKLVVEVLHGAILCTSSIGTGSSFTIRIPEKIDADSTGSGG